MKDVKKGDAITAKWANELARLARRSRITVAPPMRAVVGESGTHISQGPSGGGSPLKIFAITATPDGSEWIVDGVDQTNDLRTGYLRPGGRVYARPMVFDPDGSPAPFGDWKHDLSVTPVLIFDSIYSAWGTPNDRCVCWHDAESDRWEVVRITTS